MKCTSCAPISLFSSLYKLPEEENYHLGPTLSLHERKKNNLHWKFLKAIYSSSGFSFQIQTTGVICKTGDDPFKFQYTLKSNQNILYGKTNLHNRVSKNLEKVPRNEFTLKITERRREWRTVSEIRSKSRP